MSGEVYQIIVKRRSIRRFKPDKIPYNLLERFVNAGRFAPSGGNLQLLEYIVVNNEDLLEKIFSLVKFAGYLDWNPTKEEMPRAYIVILAKKERKYDVGLAAENIILTALEEGVGSCLMGAFEKDKVGDLLKVPRTWSVELLVALGYPAESPVCEELEEEEESIKYWKDASGILHVPKRKLKDILHRNEYRS